MIWATSNTFLSVRKDFAIQVYLFFIAINIFLEMPLNRDVQCPGGGCAYHRVGGRWVEVGSICAAIALPAQLSGGREEAICFFI